MLEGVQVWVGGGGRGHGRGAFTVKSRLRSPTVAVMGWKYSLGVSAIAVLISSMSLFMVVVCAG